MIIRRLGASPRERGCMSNENCPDVFELANGDFAVIGSEMTDQLDGHLPGDAARGPNERIVVVNRDVFIRACRDLPEG